MNAVSSPSLIPGFQCATANVNGVSIRYAMGGKGPGLLLLHGHPQTHVLWHRVAPQLAQRYRVIAADLRGYGDSSKPLGLPDHSNYSKRSMAADQVALMRSLGHEQFSLVAHDRGARVAHRLAMDHAPCVQRMVLLDIAPTLAMYEQTSMDFATAYWHWFFLIQPTPFPETLINADPQFYLTKLMGNRPAGLAPFSHAVMQEYLRCISDPAAVHGMCEDYRAAASIDLLHDRADREAGRMIECPLLVLWGERGVIGRCFDPMLEWRKRARDVRGQSLPCGHYIAEEAPEALLQQVIPFLEETS